jgi:hypothetical protein
MVVMVDLLFKWSGAHPAPPLTAGGQQAVKGTGQLEILGFPRGMPACGQGKISIAPERRLLNSADR